MPTAQTIGSIRRIPRVDRCDAEMKMILRELLGIGVEVFKVSHNGSLQKRSLRIDPVTLRRIAYQPSEKRDVAIFLDDVWELRTDKDAGRLPTISKRIAKELAKDRLTTTDIVAAAAAAAEAEAKAKAIAAANAASGVENPNGGPRRLSNGTNGTRRKSVAELNQFRRRHSSGSAVGQNEEDGEDDEFHDAIDVANVHAFGGFVLTTLTSSWTFLVKDRQRLAILLRVISFLCWKALTTDLSERGFREMWTRANVESLVNLRFKELETFFHYKLSSPDLVPLIRDYLHKGRIVEVDYMSFKAMLAQLRVPLAFADYFRLIANAGGSEFDMQGLFSATANSGSIGHPNNASASSSSQKLPSKDDPTLFMDAECFNRFWNYWQTKICARPSVLQASLQRRGGDGGALDGALASSSMLMSSSTRDGSVASPGSSVRSPQSTLSGDSATAAAKEPVSLLSLWQTLADPERNSWYEPSHIKSLQDMTQPLHHYFMNSSHNTYLTGDQLQSKSDVDMYARVLYAGGRCVELDCWDGPNGEPVIYHGYTRTSKIPVKEVLEAIRDNAFVTSPFPVVLSVENHTSVAQGTQMATWMREIFGTTLLLPGHTEPYTPEGLKNKIIIKWKGLDEGAEETADAAAEDDGAGGGAEGAAPVSQAEQAKIDAEAKKRAKKAAKHSHAKIPELSAVVTMPAHKTKDWGASAKPENVESITENKVANFAKKNKQHFIEMNCRMFTRVYPAGSRVNSSNYDPTPAWSCGAQIVALNYQTWHLPMHQNAGLFERNRNCGFVLKPEYLRIEGIPKPEHRLRLTIRVLGGVQIPPLVEAGLFQTDEMKVTAVVTADAVVEKSTGSCKDNFISPWWDQTLSFDVGNPEMTLVTLVVLVGNEPVAAGTCPLVSLRRGVRCVPLRSFSEGYRLDHTFLVCHFDLVAADKNDTFVDETVAAAEQQAAAAAAANASPSGGSNASPQNLNAVLSNGGMDDPEGGGDDESEVDPEDAPAPEGFQQDGSPDGDDNQSAEHEDADDDDQGDPDEEKTAVPETAPEAAAPDAAADVAAPSASTAANEAAGEVEAATSNNAEPSDE